MYKSGLIVLAMMIVLLAASCAPVIPTATPAPILTEEPAIPVTGTATVESIEIQILESNPLQVNAILRGQLPDTGCTTISSVDQMREGNTFKLTLTTTTDPLALCAQALTPFERVVPLDVSNLPPGSYLVNANGHEQSFELPAQPAQTLEEFRQQLLADLNARDYKQLKSMMDPTFMIAYWQSEGNSNTPEQAVEQLQRNLLSSTSPVSADPNKDLTALLGMNPVTILGPNVVEASPLFTSGWGAEGKDEVILFIAKRQNGEFYWYGLLFAKVGFAQPNPVPTPRPVDMNAYQTNVKYVMAQQDVNMRSGPGMQFSVISYIAEGQTAKVTGVSADKNWWRVICPNDSVGSCWISAATSLTKPSDGPQPDTSPYPTNVKYVTVLRDVNIYIGPGTHYTVVGHVAAGQTVQVLGVNVDKSWWQVPCLADEVNCWISANPSHTKPAGSAAPADVQSVEVQVLSSNSVQANAIARGMLPDAGCTTISAATQSRTGNTFTVNLMTKRDPLAFCAQMLTPFEYVIPLDVSSLLPGRYNVNVNGVFVSFDLPGPVSYP